MKVIIVDGKTATGDRLEWQISEWNYEVARLDSGQAALDVLQGEHRPVLFLVGAKLPDIPALQLCARLKAAKAGSQLYILLIIPKDDKENIVCGLQAGADDYILKSAESEELRSRLAIGRRIVEYQNTLDNLTQELQSKNLELGRARNADGLTGIAGRGRFQEKLDEEWRRAWREGSVLSVLLLDIDFFKAYNDAYGHAAGDDCLRKVARTLVGSVSRAGDLAARFGGEEFAVILPNTDSLGSLVVAEALRVAVAALGIEHKASAIHRYLTVSVGTATSRPDEGQTADSLLSRAEAALAQAKEAGRNNVRQY